VLVTPHQITRETYRPAAAALGRTSTICRPGSAMQELARKERENRTVVLAEDIPRERMAAIGTTMDTAGLAIRAESRRYYPHETCSRTASAT
jgi:hypothetical protein